MLLTIKLNCEDVIVYFKAELRPKINGSCHVCFKNIFCFGFVAFPVYIITRIIQERGRMWVTYLAIKLLKEHLLN